MAVHKKPEYDLIIMRKRFNFQNRNVKYKHENMPTKKPGPKWTGLFQLIIKSV
jgi:hypothetical protein